MLLPPAIANEDARLENLIEYDVLRPFPVEPYEPVLSLARDLFDVPAVFMSFVGRDVQEIHAAVGMEPGSIGRDVSVCAHVIAGREMLVIPDARADRRFADNPFIVGPPYVRFYAGVPLISPAGHALGAFCLVDQRSRPNFSRAERAHLTRLSATVLDKLEARRLDLARRNGQAQFEVETAGMSNAVLCADAEGRITFWNEAAARMFGRSAAAVLGQPLDLIVPDRLREAGMGVNALVQGGMQRLIGSRLEVVAMRADGSEFPAELSLSVWGTRGQSAIGAVLRDLSSEVADRSRRGLARDAAPSPRDTLTGLPNRADLRNRIERMSRSRSALLLLDLDGLKSINDEWGNDTGDLVLQEVARRIRATVDLQAFVARFDGDEFAVVFDAAGPADAGMLANRLIREVSRPIAIAGREAALGVSISVGIASYPADGTTADALLANANLALYRAKADGRHCYRAFTPELRQAADRARVSDFELHRAVEEREFEVFYQPQVRLADGCLVGAEALLRWRHPSRGLLSPAAFLASLESRPISAVVGQWVLQTACAQTVKWRRDGAGSFRMGVNLFGTQFHDPHLVRNVRRVLDELGLPPDGLELEITENIMLSHDETDLAALRELRSLGVGIAFDDYGTGFASLSMLKRFPISRLKIDQSFVRGMLDSSEDRAIIRAILDLGRAFSFDVIAEGIETPDQAHRLARKHCLEGQGYLFGRPMPAPAFETTFGLAPETAVRPRPTTPPLPLALTGVESG